jgi:hypothetical protein
MCNALVCGEKKNLLKETDRINNKLNAQAYAQMKPFCFDKLFLSYTF